MTTVYRPDIAIHPGETLDETLEFLGMSQADLSERTGLSAKHISNIVSGKASITPETAIKLERVLGVKAEFWNNLQKNYEGMLARLESDGRVSEETECAKKFLCYPELADLGMVEKVSVREMKKRVENLLRFFRVDSLQYVGLVENVAFRNRKGKVNQESLAAWLRCGEIEAEKIKTGEFSREGVRAALDRTKDLISLPDGFDKKLQEFFAPCGVAVVYTPYFKNTKINGATRWMGGKAVVQLNCKGSFSDIFWFTFFHEIGHVLLHGKTEQFLEIPEVKDNAQKENEADEFAKERLIPSVVYKNILEGKITAKEAGIDEDILWGRMAHDEHISWREARRRSKKRLIFINGKS